MSSETPKENARAHSVGNKRDSNFENEELPGSLGLEISEHIHMEDGADHGQGIDSMDPGAMLMPHERKMPLSMQRQLLAMRRHVDDDDAEVQEVRSGHKSRRPHARMHDHASQAGERGKGRHGRGSHRSADGEPALDADAQRTTPGNKSATAKGGAESHALLDNDANPHKPLFEAVQKGVGNLDPSKVALTASERINIIGALTANTLHTPGFHRANPDPETISISASDTGDRIFAVNSLNPGSPGAVYTNVVVDVARRQSLEVSTALAAAYQPTAAAPTPANEQLQQGESPAPRIVVT